MSTTRTILIAVTTFIGGFVFGGLATKKAIIHIVEDKKPLLVNLVASSMEKALKDGLKGEELTAYFDEQLEFIKIAMRD
jgi:hypothetical protein